MKHEQGNMTNRIHKYFFIVLQRKYDLILNPLPGRHVSDNGNVLGFLFIMPSKNEELLHVFPFCY